MSIQLFDRIRAFIKSAGVYGHENLLQNQGDITRTIEDGELINYSTSGILDQTNLQINRMERYKDYDQMDEMGEISLALDLYADESTQIDPETKHSIGIRAKNEELKVELENLFFDILNIDNKLRPMVRYICKYGDFAAEIITDEHRSGVASYRPFNIYNFIRVETKFGDLVGFFFTDEMTPEPIFLHPWQVMHLRLTSYENIYAPYGRSILDGARKDFRRLRLMEDAALIYRITRAPEKRIFTIPVGNIPTNQIQQYLNQIADQFKKQRFYDPATGEVNWRYAPLIQEDDFWMPQRPDGSGPSIDTLKGAENLDQIQDIEYFKKKMVAPLKIPFERVGIGENAGGNADRTLASSHTDFAKAVQYVQQEICIGLKKIALVHLALKGFDSKDLGEFDLTMTSSSAIDELYRIETWNSRAGVISTLKDTGMFTDDWILSRFTDLTQDEIDKLREERNKKESNEPSEEEIGGDGEIEDMDLGLPGLEHIDKDQARILVEYRNINEARNNRIKKLREIKYIDMFSYLLNNNELDGLPLTMSKNQTITESSESNKNEDDPFVIIGNADKTVEEIDGANQYMISPLFNEDSEEHNEAHRAYFANKEVITRISHKEDSEEMQYPILKISNGMDE